LAGLEATVLCVPRHTVRHSLKEERFATAWRTELSRELRRLRAQCERLSLKGAPNRIIHYLETEGEHGAVTLTQTKKQWAAELGLTHEALYRTLTKMRNSGATRIDGRMQRLTRGNACNSVALVSSLIEACIGQYPSPRTLQDNFAS
jgi:CRP-like cAMP-binding protein